MRIRVVAQDLISGYLHGAEVCRSECGNLTVALDNTVRDGDRLVRFVVDAMTVWLP